MARLKHYHDPNGPTANSIVPAVSTVVTNDRGENLLQKRIDNGLWALPGGVVEVGENVSDTVVGEVKEETGLDVEPIALIGIYSDPHQVIEYSDGEARQQFSLCFAARLLGGTVAVSAASSAVNFVSPDDLDTLDTHPSMRLRIRHYLEHRKVPYIG